MVYQFALSLDENGEFGLVFSSESETDYNSPIFAITTSKSDLFENKSLRFPGEINGRYVEFRMSTENGRFRINDNKIGIDINFRTYFSLNDYRYFPKRFLEEPFIYSHLKYIGNEKNMFDSNEMFQIIVPTDLILLDLLYKEKGFCLVGHTPIFNEENQ
jgi:hypothetical protein